MALIRPVFFVLTRLLRGLIWSRVPEEYYQFQTKPIMKASFIATAL
jgi:hypothetical protein